MSKLVHKANLTGDILRGMIGLCNVPYEIADIERASAEHGWESLPLEDWEDAFEPILRIRVDVESTLIALWGAERLAGLPLAVVFEDDVSKDLSHDSATVSELHSRFEICKRTCGEVIGIPAREGEYTSEYQPFSLRYALYRCEYSTMALMEHHEGDGHLGNAASLDLRITPQPPEAITFPLETNLIF